MSAMIPANNGAMSAEATSPTKLLEPERESTYTHTNEFKLFPKLPIELRLKIWKIAISGCRLHVVTLKIPKFGSDLHGPARFCFNSTPSSLLSVSRESRIETKTMTYCMAAEGDKRILRLHTSEIPLFRLRDLELPRWCTRSFEDQISYNEQKVQFSSTFTQIAMDLDDLTIIMFYNPRLVATFLQKFNQVKVVFLLPSAHSERICEPQNLSTLKEINALSKPSPMNTLYVKFRDRIRDKLKALDIKNWKVPEFKICTTRATQ